MEKLLNNAKWKKQNLIFMGAAILCLSPVVSSPIALLLGFTLAMLGLVPKRINMNLLTKNLLAYSIIGLGFGINLDQAIAASKDAFGLIVLSLLSTLIIGWLLTKRLRINPKTGYLIASGTAVCGGSAIAAVAPAINASKDQTSIALATVFLLNSVALFLFPFIGHLLSMTQHAFGVWCAIAIHDTSSVVGAASAYGDEALLIATTLKLARALWIIPIAFISALLFKGDNKKITVPTFILFYCLSILVAYYLPQFSSLYEIIFSVSKRFLVLSLFLIGSAISFNKIKSAGAKPLVLGVLLWIITATGSLAYIQLLM
ncbi:conserved hypothetical protein 698 [Psychromonas ingrahamii 37]|uniref:Sulfate exporter family transporter n=1 Tax=Psychromonas ingrahamii (strain DSM 17664 / CCUG 51855 / 37) TaxID=357804 RepID=A1SVF9_PSYIN|nr:putative sulfate exporter family transporter [Psychromonas ingrahamii]ABM03474.1 conserved hypothetical protein 698 [Psychromonas ingrahamii 37]